MLTVALVQVASSREPEENRQRLARLRVPTADLVVLPEAYACDFGDPDSPLGRHAEPLDGPFVEALTARARAHGGTWVAGMFERGDDPQRPFNTLVVVDGDGLRASYRKIHLYDSFGYQESSRLAAGPLRPVLVDVAGVPVGLMTCYDLRFPEMARALVSAGAELLAVPAAWVAGPRKVHHWRTLAVARAIEDVCYVAAAGQSGPRYSGHSLLVDPRGDVLTEADTDDEMLTGRVSRDAVAAARQENPSLANRRDGGPWEAATVVPPAAAATRG